MASRPRNPTPLSAMFKSRSDEDEDHFNFDFVDDNKPLRDVVNCNDDDDDVFGTASSSDDDAFLMTKQPKLEEPVLLEFIRPPTKNRRPSHRRLQSLSNYERAPRWAPVRPRNPTPTRASVSEEPPNFIVNPLRPANMPMRAMHNDQELPKRFVSNKQARLSTSEACGGAVTKLSIVRNKMPSHRRRSSCGYASLSSSVSSPNGTTPSSDYNKVLTLFNYYDRLHDDDIVAA